MVAKHAIPTAETSGQNCLPSRATTALPGSHQTTIGKWPSGLKISMERARPTKRSLHAERSRAAVLEYSNTSAPLQRLFRTPKELEGYLSSLSHTSFNLLYILEDISTNYVEAFGPQFSIEPSFWARHLRTTDRETSKTAGSVSALPSIRSLDTKDPVKSMETIA
jgi:hypothetical protein